MLADSPSVFRQLETETQPPLLFAGLLDEGRRAVGLREQQQVAVMEARAYAERGRRRSNGVPGVS